MCIRHAGYTSMADQMRLKLTILSLTACCLYLLCFRLGLKPLGEKIWSILFFVAGTGFEPAYRGLWDLPLTCSIPRIILLQCIRTYQPNITSRYWKMSPTLHLSAIAATSLMFVQSPKRAIVATAGIEPATFCASNRRSTNWATLPEFYLQYYSEKTSSVFSEYAAPTNYWDGWTIVTWF